MAIIVINATAIKSSGALTLLNSYIEYIQNDNSNKYYLFTTLDTYIDRKNIKIIRVRQNSWIKRILWDEGGLYRYCINKKIEPELIISLQNTCTLYPKIPQLVYYHQLIPLVKYNWNILKKSEFILFLYSKFYIFFVKRNSEKAFYCVQLKFIKNLLISKLSNIDKERVRIIKPNIPDVNTDNINKIMLKEKEFLFFYPSTLYSYKNHRIIIEALVLLKRNSNEVLNKIKILFTIDKLDNRLMKIIKKNELDEVVVFIGSIKYEEVLSYYKSVNALIFPSRIETFGLPLIEAAAFGLPIICSDLPYANEVLEEYKNVHFVDPENQEKWADEICNFKNLKRGNLLIKEKRDNSWKNFVEYAEEILKGEKICSKEKSY